MRFNRVAKYCALACGLGMFSIDAWAAGTCRTQSFLFTALPNYDNALISSTGSIVVRCSRAATDGVITVTVKPNAGANSDGTYRRLSLAPSLLPYYLSVSNSSGSTGGTVTTYSVTGSSNWGDSTLLGGSSAITVVFNGTNALTNSTVTIPFTLYLLANGNPPAGTSTSDTVTFSGVCSTASAVACTWSSSITSGTSFKATSVAKCRISTLPSAMNLSYTSFQTSAATNTSSYGVTCSNTTPYTMNLNGTGASVSGAALGLNYSLTLPVTSGTGNAGVQNYSINGSVAANQSGTCSSSTCSQTITTNYVQIVY